MKKLILLLTLIPLVGASQTFDEISSINNTDGFSRVMIENGFQRYSKDSLFVSYIFNPQGEGLNVKAERMGHWDIENKEFVISFFSDNFLGYSTYGKIIRSIKEKLEYIEIYEDHRGEWALYLYEEKGVILGFQKKDGWLMVLGITSKIV